jgi:hypothetical protein
MGVYIGVEIILTIKIILRVRRSDSEDKRMLNGDKKGEFGLDLEG